MICPACGSVMYEARLLKGYDKTGKRGDRLTCALHGPLGPFRHIATDRKSDALGTQAAAREKAKHGG